MKEYKAGIYLRLSKEDTNTNNSIEAQRDITLKYAKEHNINVINEYVDNGYSGIIDSRPALNKMIIDILRKKIDMVIVKDLSRLTRDKNKTGYYTEIEDTSKKIKAVKTNMKKQGKYVEKNVPYGYKKDENDKYKVIVDEDVADNVKLIFNMYLNGFTQGEIAKYLTRNEYRYS